MLLCHCRGVTDRTVAACVAGGARTVEELAERCGAGGRCGGCVPVLEDILVDVAVGLNARPGVAA